MRQASNVDSFQVEAVNAARGLGCSVLLLHKVGQGCPDALLGVPAGRFALNLLVEFKSYPALTLKGEPMAKGSLSPEQEAWHSAWKGQVAVIHNLAELGRLVLAARELCKAMDLAGVEAP